MRIDLTEKQARLLDTLLSAHEDACAEQTVSGQIAEAKCQLRLVLALRTKIRTARAAVMFRARSRKVPR